MAPLRITLFSSWDFPVYLLFQCPFILRRQLRNPLCCHVVIFTDFFVFSINDNTFERNEDCATVFLKWTDFTLFGVAVFCCDDHFRNYWPHYARPTEPCSPLNSHRPHLPSRVGSLANETSNFVPKSDAMGHFEKSNKNDGTSARKFHFCPCLGNQHWILFNWPWFLFIMIAMRSVTRRRRLLLCTVPRRQGVAVCMSAAGTLIRNWEYHLKI